ncbi:hypothetical protein ALC60_09667 [Trachymyrmex zeteki]|uniref:Uncharacterized protein n=1 Tax=Mycetomoellerius zeteki TaxID=64791 RepID=A0A151WTE5_9HYME|nr:hypothetical protein ALC60_09667 [Trachymyrmex zeteki]
MSALSRTGITEASRDQNVMAKGRREGRMKRGTEEVKRANERASGATREISGCAIDWRADDANAQPTSTSIQKDYIASTGRIRGNQETVHRWAELEIENRGCMEIRATKRGMSQENLKIIVRGKDCGGFSVLTARKLDGDSRREKERRRDIYAITNEATSLEKVKWKKFYEGIECDAKHVERNMRRKGVRGDRMLLPVYRATVQYVARLGHAVERCRCETRRWSTAEERPFRLVSADKNLTVNGGCPGAEGREMKRAAKETRVRAGDPGIVADAVAAFCGRINVDYISVHQLLSTTLKSSEL